MLEYLNSLFVSFSLAALAPTLLFVSVNTRYFSGRQIFYALFTAVLAGLCAAGLLSVVLLVISNIPFNYANQVGKILSALGMAGILYIFGQQLFRDLFKTRRQLAFSFAAMVFLDISCKLIFNLPILTCGLCLSIFITALDLIKNIKAEKILLIGDAVYEKNNIKHNSEYKFKTKPNIYYLFLESLHSEKSFNNIYRQEYDPSLDNFLEEYSFTTYESFYSNMSDTRGTVAVLLENKFGVDFRQAPFESPATIKELVGNGYKINFIDSIQYTFLRYAEWADYCSFAIPKWVTDLYAFLGPLFVQSTILRKAIKGIDPLATESQVTFKDILAATRSRITKAKSPSFFMIRFGARHRYKQKQAEWDSIYLQSYAQAKEDFKEMISMIVKHDPEAIIIASGDHGGKKYLEVWEGDVNKNISDAGLSHELVVQDHFGVFMAARLPKGALPLVTHSHVNIFPSLFSFLSGVSGEKYRDISIYGPWRVAENGTAFTKFECASGGIIQVDAAAALRAVNANPGDPDKYVTYANCLAERREFGKSVVFVQEALRRFPSEPRLLYLLAKSHMEQGAFGASGVVLNKLCEISNQTDHHILRAEALAYQGKLGQAVEVLKSSLKKIKHNRNDVFNYILKLLLQQRKFDEGVDFYLNNCNLSNKSDLMPRFNYARILHAKGDLQGAIKCWENLSINPRQLNNGCADIEVMRPYYFDNLTYQVNAMNWKAAKEWADLGLVVNNPSPVWYYLMKYYAMEKLGELDSVVEEIISKVSDDEYKMVYIEYLGTLLLRNKINIDALNPYKEVAQGIIGEKCKNYLESHLFDSEWYRSANASLIKRTDSGISPVLHYIYYGVYENAWPNKYFEPHYVIKNNKFLLNSGLEPLFSFYRFGNSLLADPSPYFSAKTYWSAQPEAFSGKESFLTYFLRNAKLEKDSGAQLGQNNAA